MNESSNISGEGLCTYTPLGLINLYQQVITQEGEDEFFFNAKKNKKLELEWVKKGYYYRQLYESYNVSLMCLAIHKHYDIKYYIVLSDSPDVVMINKDKCIPVEVYEAFDFWKVDKREKIDIKREVDILKEKKFNKVYGPWVSLLIVNRRKSIKDWFNVSDYIREINKPPHGNFDRIRLHIFNGAEHIFFEVFPINSQDDLVRIDYSIQRDKEYLY